MKHKTRLLPLAGLLLAGGILCTGCGGAAPASSAPAAVSTASSVEEVSAMDGYDYLNDYIGLWGICRYGTPMPVSLTFTPRGKLGQLVRSASVQNPVDGFEQQFKLTADDDTALKACLTEEKCRKLLALAGTAEGSFSGSLHRDGTLYFAVENNKGLFKGSGSDDVLREKFARQLKWCTDVMDVFAP